MLHVKCRHKCVHICMYATESFIMLGIVHVMNAWKTLVHTLRVILVYICSHVWYACMCVHWLNLIYDIQMIGYYFAIGSLLVPISHSTLTIYIWNSSSQSNIENSSKEVDGFFMWVVKVATNSPHFVNNKERHLCTNSMSNLCNSTTTIWP